MKALWEKEKRLVTSISSFSHYAFYPVIFHAYQSQKSLFKVLIFILSANALIWTSLKFCHLVESLLFTRLQIESVRKHFLESML